MSGLGLLFLLVVIAERLVAPGSGAATALAVAGWVLWAAFAAEFAARLAVASHRGRFLRRNWWQVIFLVLPFLRVLRLLKSLRLLRTGRVVSSTVRSSRSAGRLLGDRTAWLSMVSLIVILAASELLYELDGTHGSYADTLHATALMAISGERAAYGHGVRHGARSPAGGVLRGGRRGSGRHPRRLLRRQSGHTGRGEWAGAVCGAFADPRRLALIPSGTLPDGPLPAPADRRPAARGPGGAGPSPASGARWRCRCRGRVPIFLSGGRHGCPGGAYRRRDALPRAPGDRPGLSAKGAWRTWAGSGCAERAAGALPGTWQAGSCVPSGSRALPVAGAAGLTALARAAGRDPMRCLVARCACRDVSAPGVP